MRAFRVFLFFLSGLLVCTNQALAQDADPSLRSDSVLADSLRSEIESATVLKPREGERCIVCGLPLTDKDVVLLVRGRRLPLIDTRENRAKLLAHPERYFGEVQPRGAWFSESLSSNSASYVFFLLGIIVVVLLVSAGLSSHAALCRGAEAEKWFFRGLYGSFAAVLCACKSGSRQVPWNQMKIAATVSPEPCKCGASNHPSATSCSTCGLELQPAYESEARRVLKSRALQQN